MATVYVNASRVQHDAIEVDLETLLVLNVCGVCDSDSVALKVQVKESDEVQFKVMLSSRFYEVVDDAQIPEIGGYCKWPIAIVGCTVVAGLCSVSRQIIKSSGNEAVENLLGFRKACLAACSESSIWTKFCEIDMLSTVKRALVTDQSDLPIDLTRFEYHMEQPVRIHNVYKLAREKNNDKDIKSSIPIKDLNLSHSFSEGPFISLADVLLYPCFNILFNVFSHKLFEAHFPLTHNWFKTVASLNYNFASIKLESVKCYDSFKQVKHANIPHQSLYTSDPTRYRPQSRIYTKQSDVENALNLAKTLDSEPNEQTPYGYDVEFGWESVPMEASPEGGALPKKRSARKCQQLENLAKAVLKLAHNKSIRIVDFCSGSGHLGILLATLLPQCTVILVENKERSLLRAKERIANLNLTNVVLVQSNLDYFKANFDLGIALHACGVATDLVVQSCVDNKADFVVCPCCYGGIHNCHHLQYPRSKVYQKSIQYGDYLNIAHAADQTHDNENEKTKQGFACMDVIDADRKCYAIECGYAVHLGKLIPTNCTPKNNLLVGIYQ